MIKLAGSNLKFRHRTLNITCNYKDKNASEQDQSIFHYGVTGYILHVLGFGRWGFQDGLEKPLFLKDCFPHCCHSKPLPYHDLFILSLFTRTQPFPYLRKTACPSKNSMLIGGIIKEESDGG